MYKEGRTTFYTENEMAARLKKKERPVVEKKPKKKESMAWARRKIVAKRSSGSTPPILPKGIRRIERKPTYSVLTGRRLD